MAGKEIEGSVLGEIRRLETGEERAFPIERLAYVRSVVSTFSPAWRRRFSTSTDRKAGTITVRRIA